MARKPLPRLCFGVRAPQKDIFKHIDDLSVALGKRSLGMSLCPYLK
jgi:hypothetical protein